LLIGGIHQCSTWVIYSYVMKNNYLKKSEHYRLSNFGFCLHWISTQTFSISKQKLIKLLTKSCISRFYFINFRFF
jgi:hypothetical protein